MGCNPHLPGLRTEAHSLEGGVAGVSGKCSKGAQQNLRPYLWNRIKCWVAIVVSDFLDAPRCMLDRNHGTSDLAPQDLNVWLLFEKCGMFREALVTSETAFYNQLSFLSTRMVSDLTEAQWNTLKYLLIHPCMFFRIGHHKRPYVGASHARSWSPLLVLGAILWEFIAKN